MKNRVPIYLMILTGISLIGGACSNTRFLAENQLLYTGKKEVIISDSGKFNDVSSRQLIESVTFYKPNNSVGGKRILLPVGLWVYNYRKPETNKKPGWIYRTLAKEPVLVSTVDPESRCLKLESELFGKGYFHAGVWSSIDTSGRNPRKAGITYYIKPGTSFRYNEISFKPPEDEVDSILYNYKKNLILEPDDQFDLDKIKSETNKITNLVLENGYFFFNQSHVKYIADTTRIPYKIDLRIGKNEEIQYNAIRKYFIDSITVRIGGNADSSEFSLSADTTFYDGITIISEGMQFKPEVIARSIHFRKGDRYSVSKHRQTMAHINSYGIFKFINLRYIPDPDTLVNELDIMIELSPMKDISLDLEANVVTKSTGFSGPGFAATISQGNFARGANRLQLKLNGGLEWQWANNSSSTLGTVSYNVGLSSSIIFPKLIAPSLLINTGRFNLPTTSLTLGFEFLNKIQYYQMRSNNLGFGYEWKKTEKITQSFYPAFINSIDLLKTTPEFDSIMDENPYIRKSFEEQFIIGMKYDFIYDNSMNTQPRGFYFQAGIGTSGNLLDLVKRIPSEETERPYSVLGSVYSQFIKLNTDIRYYRNFHNKSLVWRIYSGLGISYTNSVVMPYVEQFYSGGSNSIRAFIARSLGPGSIETPKDAEIIDQTGDIKLEGNMEFRFKISKVLHGALFVDAGNVWLLNPDSTRPGAEFNFDTFIDQLALGTGIGLRFDFGFFVLRTDLGFPLRTPYTVDNSNWVKREGDLFKDVVFNVAIGYPF